MRVASAASALHLEPLFDTRDYTMIRLKFIRS